MDNNSEEDNWGAFIRTNLELTQTLIQLEKDIDLAKMATKNQFLEFNYEDMDYKHLQLDNELITLEKVEEIKQFIPQEPIQPNHNQQSYKENTNRLFINNFVQKDDDTQVQAEKSSKEENQMSLANNIEKVTEVHLMESFIEFAFLQNIRKFSELLNYNYLDNIPSLKYLNLKGNEIALIPKSGPLFVPNLKALNVTFRKTLPFEDVYRIRVHFDSIQQTDFRENSFLKRVIEIFESNNPIEVLPYNLDNKHAFEESRLLITSLGSLKGLHSENLDEFAVKIQKRYRIYRARQKMKKITKEIKYIDNEEDELEEVDLDFKEPDYDAFELKIPYGLTLEQILAIVSVPIETSIDNYDVPLQSAESYQKQVDVIEEKNKERCALKIQRRYRIYREKQKSAIRDLQMTLELLENWKKQLNLEQIIQETYATKIQSWYRMYKTRQRMRKLLRTINSTDNEEIKLEEVHLDFNESDYDAFKLKIPDNLSLYQIMPPKDTPLQDLDIKEATLVDSGMPSKQLENIEESKDKYAIKIQRRYRIHRGRQKMREIEKDVKYNDNRKDEFEVINADSEESNSNSFELIGSDDLNPESIVIPVSPALEDSSQGNANIENSDLSFDSLDSSGKQSNTTKEESKDKYALKIQRRYRVYKARQRMKKILKDIKYCDDEDELEAVDLDFTEPDYEAFELKIPDNVNFVDLFKVNKENNNCFLLFHDH